MEDTNPQKAIPKQVKSLIQHLFPSKLQDNVQQTYLAYFLRVLSGRICTGVVEDEYHMHTLIQKRLSKLYAHGEESSTKLARLQSLFEKLSHSQVLRKRWAILYTLYNLSEDSSVSSSVMPSSIIQETLGNKLLTTFQPMTDTKERLSNSSQKK